MNHLDVMGRLRHLVDDPQDNEVMHELEYTLRDSVKDDSYLLTANRFFCREDFLEQRVVEEEIAEIIDRRSAGAHPHRQQQFELPKFDKEVIEMLELDQQDDDESKLLPIAESCSERGG